jgi:hypothetical protein
MTGFDYVVIGIVGLSLLFGLWRGVVGEIIALVAWVLAIFVAVEFGAQVGAAVFAGMSDPALRTLAGCVVIFVGVLVVMACSGCWSSAWSRPWGCPFRIAFSACFSAWCVACWCAWCWSAWAA